MNDYDHHDYRREIERMDLQRREESAAHRAAVKRDVPEPDAARSDGSWQVSFLLRVVLHLAFYGWVAWFLLGKPEIPIKWLQ